MCFRQCTVAWGVAALFAIPTWADMVSLPADRDNTLYQHATGGISNGRGSHMFVGRNQAFAGGDIRRAVVHFNVAAAIPVGAVIQSVALQLSVSRVASGLQTTAVTLHRLNADWGEGTSNALNQEGTGAAATAGDATWLHRFSPGTTWTNQGGDWAGIPSASTDVTDVGFYGWGATGTMVADVQGWLDNPSSNFGWILRGNESVTGTAKRFDSDEFATALNRPVLFIEYINNVCCVAGACQNLTPGDCAGMGGTFVGAGACDPEICAVGGCCRPGLCDDLPGHACDAAGGAHFPGASCASADCNGNMLFDRCDILEMTSPDANGNGVPDECECVNVDLFGDVNHDMSVDIFDILCVLEGFGGVFTTCPLADLDLSPCAGDGIIDIFDILAVLDAFAGSIVCPLCP